LQNDDFQIEFHLLSFLILIYSFVVVVVAFDRKMKV